MEGKLLNNQYISFKEKRKKDDYFGWKECCGVGDNK